MKTWKPCMNDKKGVLELVIFPLACYERFGERWLLCSGFTAGTSSQHRNRQCPKDSGMYLSTTNPQKEVQQEQTPPAWWWIIYVGEFAHPRATFFSIVSAEESEHWSRGRIEVVVQRARFLKKSLLYKAWSAKLKSTCRMWISATCSGLKMAKEVEVHWQAAGSWKPSQDDRAEWPPRKAAWLQEGFQWSCTLMGTCRDDIMLPPVHIVMLPPVHIDRMWQNDTQSADADHWAVVCGTIRRGMLILKETQANGKMIPNRLLISSWWWWDEEKRKTKKENHKKKKQWWWRW